MLNKTVFDIAPSYALNKEEVASFHKNGFIGPFKVYEPEDIAERWKIIRRQLLDRSCAAYPVDTHKGVTNIANYDRHLDIDLLSEHITRPEIVDRVASILGKNVICWRTEFFPKYKGDEGTDWHQAWTFANASGREQIVWPTEKGGFGGTITAWTAFTDSTIKNGCLQLMPGTHTMRFYDESKGMEYRPEQLNAVEKESVRRGFFGYDYRQLQVDPNWKPDESKAFPLVMKAGECVIFWSTLMHASLPHRSTAEDYRMGFVCRYVPDFVKVYPDSKIVGEYGGKISLDNYGIVVVHGHDEHGVNRVLTHNRRGTPFISR